MPSKFANFANKFEDVRAKIKEKKAEDEKARSGGYDDSYKFKPSLPANKTKITYKVRILPNVHSELGEPWLLGHYHMFRRPDGKFIYTLCPTTTGGKDAPCPICEKAKKLFATQDKRDEEEARNIYKKKRYFANVLVVEDPRSGEENQEGQVLVWEFGTQVYDKLDEAIDQGINFFHPTEGRNFMLQIKKKGDFSDYNSSNWDLNESAISDDEGKMDEIFDSIHDLEKKVFGNGPKSYEKLQEMLTGESSGQSNVSRVVDSSDDDESEDSVEDTFDDDSEDTETPEPKAAEAGSSEDGDGDDFDFDFDE